MIWFGKLGKILSISLHYLAQGERQGGGLRYLPLMLTGVSDTDSSGLAVPDLDWETGSGSRQVERKFVFEAVLRIRIRIRIHRIHVFLGLQDPDPLVRGMDPDPDPALDPDPDPSIIMQK
jgi:hypothetical protein